MSLEQRITEWVENYANTHGVLASEEESHICQMAAAFGVRKDLVKNAYRRLQRVWENS